MVFSYPPPCSPSRPSLPSPVLLTAWHVFRSRGKDEMASCSSICYHDRIRLIYFCFNLDLSCTYLFASASLSVSFFCCPSLRAPLGFTLQPCSHAKRRHSKMEGLQ